MPTITIYLTNDLFDKVRDAPSKTVRAALEHYFKDEGDDPAEADDDPQGNDDPREEAPAS